MNKFLKLMVAVVGMTMASGASASVITLDNFSLTNAQYLPTINMQSVITQEFGANYRLADWNDIKSYIAGGGTSSAFVDFLMGTRTAGFEYSWISLNGVEIQSCCVEGLPRHYFVAPHGGNRPGNFAAFDTIDNATLDLGSWIRHYKILAFTDSPVSASEPTTLVLLSLSALGFGFTHRRRQHKR